MITLGIDIGSRNTKIALYDSQAAKILYSAYRATAVSPLETVLELTREAFSRLGMQSADAVACTGYGRKIYPLPDKILSEISCHAAGVRFFHPEARTIIDIGGQDAKIITLEEDGRVRDFVMNDKCAAGTGRFLEMTAIRLGCTLDELSSLAELATQNLAINSTCVVFAESEIIGLIAANVHPAEIIRAVHESIAGRVLTQISGLLYAPPLVFTGGVAQNSALVNCLARQLQAPISVPPDPEITAALGAALLVSR